MKVMQSLCAAALALCGVARAAPPVYEFECDTPAGHFSYWSRTLSSSKVKVTGTLEIKEKREHPEWFPLASTLLLGKNPESWVSLQVYTIPSQKEFLFLRLVKPGDEDGPPFAMLPSNTSSISFSMTLASNGTFAVNAADKAASTEIKGFKPQQLHLSCSTGDFLFKDVSIR